MNSCCAAFKNKAAACLLLLCLQKPQPARAEVDAAALYRAALAAMQHLTEPAYLRYRTTVPAGDATVEVSRGDGDWANVAVLNGASAAQSWHVDYRSADGIASIRLANETRTISRLAIFDPTWQGALTWLRDGLGASIRVPAPASSAPATSAPQLRTPPPVIGVVSAIDEREYAVRDGGPATCPNGAAARRLWTSPKSDPLQHPLREVEIEVRRHRFCAMRFQEHLVSPTVTFDLSVELAFSQIGENYLITAAIVDGAVRPYRRPGWFRMHTAFLYDDFAFPPALPDAAFAPAG
jgi:hypothetical protein